MCNHHDKKADLRPGDSLNNEKAHQKDHLNWSRRSFVRNLGLVGGVSMFLGKTTLTAIANNPLSQALNGAESDRILVLIRLKGGNDGLNTIIPLFDYGAYQQLRPSIRVPENEVIQLNDAFGVPSYMSSLENLWNDGQMKVVNSVGYPDQNLSHFRSSEIWASASDADTVDLSGWLGRYMEEELPDFLTNPPKHPPAIQIGGTGNLVFNNSGMNNMGVVVNDPEQLTEIAQKGQLYDIQDVPDCYRGEQLSYLRTVANSTFRYAGIISDTFNNAQNQVEYQQNPLSNQLAVVARLIKGGLSTKLYMVSLDGFDTHAKQNETHPYLLHFLSEAVHDFFEDLKKFGDHSRVLGMTFSEFGRRIEQNASQGTDHGAAAPVMLFGGGLEEHGFIGDPPDLKDLDVIGNLKFDVDFRQIYATVLENWLCIDGQQVNQIMGDNFERLPGLGLKCSPMTAVNDCFSQKGPSLKIVRYSEQFRITFELPKAEKIRLSLYDFSGKRILELKNGYFSAGKHQVDFYPSKTNIIPGQYICTLQSRSGVSSKALSYF